MEKLAASLGDKMTGSCPETLKKIPGMEVIGSFLTLTKSHKNSFEDQILIADLGPKQIIFRKDIDFKQLKATMEAAKKAEEQIQKTGELAYQQVLNGIVKMR